MSCLRHVTACFVIGLVGGVLIYTPSAFADLYKYRTDSGEVLITTDARPELELVRVISGEPPGEESKGGYSDPSISKKERFEGLIEAAGRKYDLPPSLIEAVIRVESNFQPDVISSAGAQGLMQLMPATADSLGVDKPFDPKQNIFGGSQLLSNLVERYDGDMKLVLAAYNAGDLAVQRAEGIPYRKTREYVKKVSHWFRYYYDRRRR